MTARHAPLHLTLLVTNPDRLLQGCEAIHRFDRMGGSIGSRGDWRLYDRLASISPLQCEVSWYDGGFCIEALDGCTYMNDASMRLHPGIRTRLKADDRLQIGEYRVLVLAEQAHAPAGLPPLARRSLTTLLDGQVCPLHALSQPLARHAGKASLAIDELDPLASLEGARQASADPALAQLFDNLGTGARSKHRGGAQ